MQFSKFTTPGKRISASLDMPRPTGPVIGPPRRQTKLKSPGGEMPEMFNTNRGAGGLGPGLAMPSHRGGFAAMRRQR